MLPISVLRPQHIVLLLILFFAALLRLYNIDYGLGTHPDERHMVMVAERLSWSDPNPHHFAYGSLPYYLLWLSSETLGLCWPELTRYDGLFIVGRVLCALCGLLTILFTYLFARRVTDNAWVGVLAAALLGFNFFHIQLSRYFTSDIPLSLFCLLTLYGAAVFYQSTRWWSALLFAVPLGMALATKISSVFLAVPIALVFLAKLLGERIHPIRAFGVIIVSALVTALVLFVCAPYFFLDYHTFRAHIEEQTGMVRGLWRPPYTLQYENTTPYLYHLQEMFNYTMGWPVAVAAIAGVCLAAYHVMNRFNIGLLLLLSWVSTFFLATAGFQVKFPRYLLPIYAPIFILTAYALLPSPRTLPFIKATHTHRVSAQLGLITCYISQYLNRPSAKIIGNVCMAVGFMAAFVLGSLPDSWGLGLLAVLLGACGAMLTAAFRDSAARYNTGHIYPAIRASTVTPGEIGCIVSIIALTLTFRLVALDTLPFHLHNDEMSSGLAARLLLEGRSAALFSTGWLSQPQLSYAITALFLYFDSNSLITLRLPSVLFGTLSVISLYFLIRALWGTRSALIAGVLLAFSHWHLHFSRSGFVYMQGASFVLMALCAVVWAFKTKRLSLAVLGAFLLSIAIQTSVQATLLFAAILLWGFVQIAIPRLRATGIGWVYGIMLGAFCYFILPVLFAWSNFRGAAPWSEQNYFIFAPQHWNHVSSVYRSTDWSAIMHGQLVRSLGLFWGGTDSSLQYGGALPALDACSTIVFIVGLLACLKRALTDRLSALVLGCFIILFAFGGILSIDPPSFPRLLAACLLIPGFTALGFDSLIACAEKGLQIKSMRNLIGAIAMLVIGCSIYWNINGYFFQYANSAPMRRDVIVRLLSTHPSITTLINASDDPEDFNYESYRFVAPRLRGVNLSSLALESMREVLAPQTSALVLLKPGGSLPSAVRDAVDIITEGDADGFRWVVLNMR